MRRRRGPISLLLVMIACGPVSAGTAVAQGLPRHGPRLSAASNLSQGGQARLLATLRSLGVRDLRDAMPWGLIETQPGAYDFDGPRARFPDDLIASDIRVSTVINWGHPLYDDGDTPVTPQALSALSAFSAAVAARFPGLDSIEVGNEFNGTNFVRGPMRDMTALDRARAYVPLLAAVAEGARAVRPDLRIAGGATHSLPAGYLWAMLDAGGGAHLDSLAVHPYTTPAEQLVRQVAVLRRHPQAAALPLEVTEFGHPDPDAAASHFLRNYCQMALSGVSRAAWYPLNDRGDGMVPLIRDRGQVTGAGRAYALIARWMEGRAVTDPTEGDPHTFGCTFGGDVAVMWGAAQSVTVAPGITVLGPDGRAAQEPLMLGPADPLVFIDAGGGDAMAAVTLGGHGVIADSFHDFAYPLADEALAPGDTFARFARRGSRILPLQTRPGQEAPGTPWFPYRGHDRIKPGRLTADTLLPAGGQANPVQIVHSYTAPRAMAVHLTARFTPDGDSEDGISVTATVNGAELAAQTSRTAIALDRPLDLAPGDVLEIAAGPNGTARGDLTRYRITLTERR